MKIYVVFLLCYPLTPLCQVPLIMVATMSRGLMTAHLILGFAALVRSKLVLEVEPPPQKFTIEGVIQVLTLSLSLQYL